MLRKHLIIDTNIWIYLASGYNPEKNILVKENNHIKLFNKLYKLVWDGQIIVLSNPIILDEWKRNKNATRSYINKLNNKKGSVIFDDIQSIVGESSKSVIEKLKYDYYEAINKEIKNQEQHIQNVENLLFNLTTECKVSDSSKITATQYAIEKKAPFIGNKSNSMADMLILLSTIEYIDEVKIKIRGDYVYPKTFFVSFNKRDFAKNKTNPNEFHDDLTFLTGKTEIQLSCELYEIINKLYDEELFSEEDFTDEHYMGYCPCCEGWYNSNIYAQKNIIIRDLSQYIPDTNQLELPLDIDSVDIKSYEDNAYIKTVIGECTTCSCEFTMCSWCNELLPMYYDDDNTCNTCNTCNLVIKDNPNRKLDIKEPNYYINTTSNFGKELIENFDDVL